MEKDLTDSLWELLNHSYKSACKKSKYIQFDESKKDDFAKIFKSEYKDFKEKYMVAETKYLDRHKVAALTIIASIKSEAITCNKDLKNQIFIGSELLAINAALSYMLNRFNNQLMELGLNKIESYVMPITLSCDTPYIEVLARDLYYNKINGTFNILDLSDRLYLLEYISITKNGIDPEKLKMHKPKNN